MRNVAARCVAFGAMIYQQNPASPASPTSDNHELISLYEAALILGMTEAFVQDQIRSGVLPVIRTETGRRAFRRADLEAFAQVRGMTLR